jgi:hypothetical protein
MLALLSYGLLAALFYAPVLLGIRTFAGGDFTDHFLPFSLFQHGELLAVRLPVWNPYTYAGHPFLADIQAAVFYPVSNLVLLLTLPLGSAAARLYALELEALIEFVLAGFFTFLLVYTLVRQWLPSFLAGGVFVLSGYLTGYPALQLAILRSAIWLPLVLWLLMQAFEQPLRWRWWVGASLVYAVAFLAGHPQTFLHLSYVVAAWIVFLLIRSRRRTTSPLPLGRTLGRVALFYGVFLGLSAAQILPSVEFTRLSVRATGDYAFVSGGLLPNDTWQLILPRLSSLYAPLYVGIVALSLALLAVVQAVMPGASTGNTLRRPSPPEWRPFVGFFAAAALVALLISYGRHGFLFAFFYRWLPGWNLFQGQERTAYLVALSLSVLAGIGLAGVGSLASRTRRLTALTCAGLVFAAMTAFLLRNSATGVSDAPLASVRQVVVVSSVSLVALVLILWPGGWSRLRMALLTALALAELFVANAGTNTEQVGLAQQAALPPPALAMQAAVAEAAAAGEPQAVPGRAYNEHQVFEDYGIRTRVEELWGSSPLRLARYAALLESFPSDRLWRLMGVQHVLSAQAEIYAPSQRLAELPGPGGSSYLYRLAEPGPRAWVVPSVQSMEDGDALPWLADARFDPGSAAILPPLADSAEREGFAGDGFLALPGQDSVRLQRLAPNRLRAEVQSEHGGLLVVSENWMPGWHASVKEAGTIEPRHAPVVRADVTLLGVPVGSGQSTVELSYWPTSISTGLWISGGTLLLLGLGGALALIARRGRAKVVSRRPAVEVQAGSAVAGSMERRATATGAAIVLAAFGLRVFRLGYQELSGAEASGYFLSLKPVSEIVRAIIKMHSPHPVAGYFVESGWLRLAGHSEFALRFASVWFGVLAVALLYRLGRRLGLGPTVSALAAGWLTMSPYAIWHSQDARMVAMSLALTTASTWLALEAIRRTRWLPWAVGYVLVSWLALQTHYLAVFVLLAQNLFVIILALLDRPTRPRLVRWLPMQAGIALLYLPWLIVAWGALTGYRGAGDSPGLSAMLLRSLGVFAAGETAPVAQRGGLALLAAALLLIGAVRLILAGPQARRALLLVLCLCLPVLCVWLSALQRPVFNERHLIAALPPFCLLAAAAVLGWRGEKALPSESSVSERANRRARQADGFLAWPATAAMGLLLLGALGSLAGYYTDPSHGKTRGWQELAAVLDRYSAGLPTGQVRLAENDPDPTLWYYYRGPVEHLVLPPAANDLAASTAEVEELVSQGVQRVVIPVQTTPSWGDTGIAERALAHRYTQLTSTRVAGWTVQVFAQPPSSLRATDETFLPPGPSTGAEAGIRLAAFAVPAQRLVPGDVLDAYLAWEGTAQTLTGSEKVTLQLLDGAGRLVSQTDQPLRTSDLKASSRVYVLPIPWQLSPGEYRLIAAVYDPTQPGAPRFLTAAGADHVDLAAWRG